MSLFVTKNSAGEFLAAVDTFSEAGVGTPVEVSDSDVTIQLNGTATAVSVVLQRSTIYPGPDGSLGNWGPVDVAMTGDLTAGVSALVYVESDHAWWRANVGSVSGGNITTSVSSRQYN